MKVVFFGSSRYVLPIIEVLKNNFDLTLVVTTEKQSADAVPKFCLENKIPYISISSFDDKKIGSEIGIVADFGLMIPSKILNAFEHGLLNIHPSLLPKYRGPTPVQAAILNGETKTGITIIKLDEEMDHGPILLQVEEPIAAFDTAETLYERLFKIGAELLSQNINKYIKGQIKLTKQDHSRATITARLTRKDGHIDITNPPSPEMLDRMIRAYHPWPGVWSKWQMANGKWRIVKFLPEGRIQVEGKKPMSYKDFLNGYPEAKGIIAPKRGLTS